MDIKSVPCMVVVYMEDDAYMVVVNKPYIVLDDNKIHLNGETKEEQCMTVLSLYDDYDISWNQFKVDFERSLFYLNKEKVDDYFLVKTYIETHCTPAQASRIRRICTQSVFVNPLKCFVLGDAEYIGELSHESGILRHMVIYLDISPKGLEVNIHKNMRIFTVSGSYAMDETVCILHLHLSATDPAGLVVSVKKYK